MVLAQIEKVEIRRIEGSIFSLIAKGKPGSGIIEFSLLSAELAVLLLVKHSGCCTSQFIRITNTIGFVSINQNYLFFQNTFGGLSENGYF
ncbi:hypothetical protein BMR07_02095 [Methylococcaceae bacterium CS1]|nr:hypothetical protein BMR10_15400 [Methylococcaceae bacterium CS4]TXK93744.1 hypothetical protein BMR11_16360 [Methylococcaceae bacterium CS5]TXL04160.1 hypothetical protein BMR08_16745 [Methylococcaceae bacterium CS2]TXL08394.1 hypothetical protein BMR07_02095 [Methylococcaceae bacterium CS1]